MSDAEYMRQALAQAQFGFGEGGVPIGCVLVKADTIIGAGHNRRVQQNSAILHGEMDALEATGRRPGSFYKDITLYTTLSPCPMCAGAILLYGIPRVVVGENHTFIGEEALLAERGVAVRVLDDADCKALMRRFVAERPDLWQEDIGV